MRTYKLPAFGLEIMAEDIERVEKHGQWTKGVPKDLAEEDWRYPTNVEFQKILLPLYTLGVLNLDLNAQTGYMTRKFDPRLNDWSSHLWTLTGGTFWGATMHKHRLRLVRDL